MGELPSNLREERLEKCVEQEVDVNGQAVPYVPVGSTYYELIICNPIFIGTKGRVMVVRGHDNEKQKSLRGHSHGTQLHVPTVMQRFLPCSPMDCPVRTLLTGPCTASEYQLAKQTCLIRRQQVSDIIDFYLRVENQYTLGYTKHEPHLSQYPVFGTPDALFSHDETGPRTKAGPSVNTTTGVVDPAGKDDGFVFSSTANITPVFADLETMINDVSDGQETVIHVQASSTYEPEWEPSYLPRTFVHKFPLGRGGPEEVRQHQYSTSAILEHYGRLSHGAFWTADWVLVAYSIAARQLAANQARISACKRIGPKSNAQAWAALTEQQLVVIAAYLDEKAKAISMRRKPPDIPLDPIVANLGL